MDIIMVAGFTGSGKTKRIKEMMANEARQADFAESGHSGGKPGKIMVLVNDKGDEQYEGDTGPGDNREIVYIPQGCICCTLTAEFTSLLERILKERPDKLFLELAATCYVQDVIKIMEDMKIIANSRLKVVTMVSAEDCLYFVKYLGDFYREQIESGHEIFVTHTEECKEDELMEISARLMELNPGARIICR
ncbi:MAG: hypothetical protein K5989_03820 [Lachnospiraceae bacterium]|nr:hypothetical protein [Lachnospiraceae bacterium]